MVSLIGIAAASATSARRVVGVEATASTPAPARRAWSAAGRPSGLEAGFGEDDIDRILELVPLATHNQRGRGTL